MMVESAAPLVSVVMPLFNAAAYVEAAIESLLSQTYLNWEALIINDGSTDNSYERIRQCQDDRIKIINLPQNKGIVHALNLGLVQATGKYIARMDADDVCVPERFEKQVMAMEANPDLVVLGTGALVINEEGVLTGQQMARPQSDADIKASLFFGCPFIHPTIMIRKSVLDTHAIGYDNTITYAQDYVLYSRLWQLGSMYNLPETLLHYRVHHHPNRVTSNENKSAIIAGRMLAWQQVLKALSCPFNAELLTIHDKFCYYPGTLLPSEYGMIMPYFRFLLGLAAANRQQGAFNEAAFLKYLSFQAERVLSYPGLSLFSFIKGYQAAAGAGLMLRSKKVLVNSAKCRAKKLWNR